jgi:hypothetical protein
MDAVNLGWKLAAVLRGFGRDELLDTYTRERHPVGAAVLNNTRAQVAPLTPTPQVVALREIMSDLMDIPDVKNTSAGCCPAWVCATPCPTTPEPTTNCWAATCRTSLWCT